MKHSQLRISRAILRQAIASVCLIGVVAGTSLLGRGPLAQGLHLPTDNIWNETGRVTAALQRETGIPVEARQLQLDTVGLQRLLTAAPMELTADLAKSPAVLPLPMPDGSLARFRIEESPSMEPALAARFPAIKSYRGLGIDAPATTMRCDWSPAGLHALVLSPGRAVNIAPLGSGQATSYASFDDQSLAQISGGLQCSVTDDQVINPGRMSVSPQDVPVGPTLRTYRVAVAADWEYCNTIGGDNVSGTVASINTFLNSVDAIYERELSVHLNLVNNTSIIFSTDRGFNSGNDPYTNGVPSTMFNQNRPVLATNVGQANYDMGCVLGTNSGGIAYIGVTCNNGDNGDGMGPLKGGCACGMTGPAGNSGSVGLMGHELGHELGATHTFNGTTNSCGGGNRSAATAVEPGSGSTLMGYAGICGSDNTVTARDMRFHTASFSQISDYITNGGGSTCPATSSTGNNTPTVSGGPAQTIPKNTPFTLTATGSDADAGDVPNLTYVWEEVDAGGASFSNPPYTDAGDPANTTRPILRAFPPASSPSRTFPSLTYILNNANTPPGTINGLQTGEILPQIGRSLNFRVTIRDNRGGVNDSSVALTVDGSSGPFQVTAPNTAVTWMGGSQPNVTWNVNNTNQAPVSCANVKITLSTDGGARFPILLAASVPNTGSAQVTVPNGILTSTARVKVEAVGNIFFDVSDTNFSITPGDGCPAVSSVSPLEGTVGNSVTITGVNFTGASAVYFSNNVSASFMVNTDTQITATVPNGAVGGPITISKPGCPDRQTAAFAVCPSAPVQIAVDDGSFEQTDILGNPGTVTYYVNRLTPASYPATVGQVSIFFTNFGNLTVGTPITVVAGGSTGGTNIDNTSFHTLNTTVGSLNQFNNYPISPFTINSGDFVVGFSITTASNVFPAALDKDSPQNRSYFSLGGTSFDPLSSSGSANGNWGIRATVFLNCTAPCNFTLDTSSQSFGSAGGSGTVNVTASGNSCNWSAISNDSFITITGGTPGTGSGPLTYSVGANQGTTPRTGSMTIAGQTFTVSQSGATSLAQRAFVSGNGSDNNPCSIGAPCRTIGTALGAVAPGGEVVVLDSAGYGPFVINKAVTIIASQGVYAGISVFSGDGITISAGATDIVVLRGLTVNGLGGSNGVTFNSGQSLFVERCILNGFLANGLNFTGAGRLFTKDTIIRNNGGAGISLTGAMSSLALASIDKTRIEANGTGLAVFDGGRASIRNSVLSGNTTGAAATPSTTPAEINIEKCLVANSSTGVLAQGSAGGIGTIRLAKCTITENGLGLSQQSAGVLLSGGRNKLGGNTTDSTGTIGSYTVR
jgi:hypothetical protein